MVEATTGWLETYPVPHATAQNTILGLEKQVLWRHGTPERIESDNGTHFKNGLINAWAREHGIEWIYHIPYHVPAAGKVERCNGLLKTTLKALGGGTFKNWELNLAKATWMVNTRGSINRAGPAQSEPLHTVDGDKVPVVHMKGILGKTVWINPTSSKGRPIRGIVFVQGPGSTCTPWMVANALWGWLKRWKEANWQRGGKPIWAAKEWKDIATRVERLPVKVHHVDAHIPKSRANEEHRNNEQVDRAAKIEVSKIDLDWEHKGELFLARWAHDASGHQGRDATYKWARGRGVDLTMDSISQVIHDCETCAAIKQAKRVKPLWCYVLTMVEATMGWLETYPVPHATARNTIVGLEKQVLWRHGTPERIESDNGTHFKNSLINTWAREHGIEWVYHVPYHAPAAGKVERHNALLKTQLKALGGGSSKNWEQHLAKANWLVTTQGSTNRAGPAQAEPLHTIDGDKVPVVHVRGLLGKTVWIKSASSTDKPIRGVVFAQGQGCTWWIMQKDGTTRCVPQGDLIVG
ncbi:hypothetical protein DUI87_33965 [Hirundo rustica rustica]|uniref:Integrase catalytic domain-containing protein n=1 Tax=Hirundo rustica rustica TaxID=333673 RepID=A0A3M0IMQ5_HIRRU|nr:hypothetical protein DUI87_35606 [Hirundo rustica rustica]RMB89642.1 hypothetical protein DUI87_33965 [Hirundo rustica rustica]